MDMCSVQTAVFNTVSRQFATSCNRNETGKIAYEQVYSLNYSQADLYKAQPIKNSENLNKKDPR